MKLNQKLSLFVMISLATAVLSVVPLQAAIGQRTASVLPESVFQETTLLALSWSDILGRLRRQKVPGGSRGEPNQPTVCAIVPGLLNNQDSDEGDSLQVWALNPVFVWQDEWSQLEVFRSRDHEVLLSQVLTPEARDLVYSTVENATPLEPGGSYYWRLSRHDSEGQLETFGETSFRILGEEERLGLEAELENELAAVGAPEEVLTKRVSFFAERGLWADVFRELYTADELPAELEAQKNELAGHDFCEQPPEVAPVP